MKGLIAFSLISLLTGSQSLLRNADSFLQEHGKSQEEIHESAEAQIHEHEPFDFESSPTPIVTETPEGSATPTPTATSTATPTESPTATPTATATPIESPIASPTESASPTASPIVTGGVNLGGNTLQNLIDQIINFFKSLRG